MSLCRKLAFLSILSALGWLPVFLSPVNAQQRTAVTNPASQTETALRTWLASFEKTGAKIGPLVTHYEAASDTISIDGFSVVWPQSAVAENVKLQFTIGNLKIKGFHGAGERIAFGSLSAEGLTLSSSDTSVPILKVDHVDAANGELPGLAGFVADPAKPFTTQIRLMRLLASTKLDRASAKSIDLGNGLTIAGAHLHDVGGGKVPLLQLDGTEIAGTSVDDASQAADFISADAIEIANFDLDSYLRLFEQSAYLDSGSVRPWSDMVGMLKVQNLLFDNGSIAVHLATAKAGPLRVRQFSEYITDIFDRAALDPGFLASNRASAEKIADGVRKAFTLADVSAEMISVKGQGQAGAVSVSVAKGHIENFTADRVGSVKLEGMTVSDSTADAKLALLDVSGINLVNLPEVNIIDSASGAAIPTAVVPAIDSVKARGLSVRLEGGAIGLDGIELAMAYFVGATPTNVKIALDHLKFQPSQVAIPGLEQALTDLGYENVDVSARLTGNWDESNSALVFEEISLRGEEMGTLSLSGGISGISRKSIEQPLQLLPRELAGASVQNFKISFENDTLVDRFFSKVARENGKSVDEIKSGISSNIPFMMSAIGTQQMRNRFTFAVISFLNDPQILTFSSIKPEATPISLVMDGLRQPSILPELLKLDVSANSRRN